VQSVHKDIVAHKQHMNSLNHCTQQLIDANARLSPVVMQLSHSYQHLITQSKVCVSRVVWISNQIKCVNAQELCGHLQCTPVQIKIIDDAVVIQ